MDKITDNDFDYATQLRIRRIMQVFLSSQTAMFGLAIHQGITQKWYGMVLLLVVSLVITPVYILVKKNKLDLSITILLSLYLVTASGFMWTYKGLWDESLLAYPGILIFAFIVGNRKLAITLLAVMILNILVLGLVSSAGLYTPQLPEQGISSAISIIILLLVISFSAWLLSADLTTVVSKLSKENQRVIKSQMEIENLLNHDSLTNLPNRVLARDRFEQAVSKSNRDSTMVCLMFIDLDNFKNINDSMGHISGDQFLIKLSKALLCAVRDTDSVCRLGGDEFLIILESIKDKIEILTIIEKIVSIIKLPITIDGSSLCVTASIGIAVTPHDGRDFDSMSRNADMAMYKAKDSGKNSYCFYDKEMNVIAKHNVTLIADLQLALEKQQFKLVYQPKINLSSNKVIGAEALLRWHHPEKGLIPPVKFIPLAESSGLITKIGRWVIRQACQDCKIWTSGSLKNLPVAVNVSSIQFKRGDMQGVVLEALSESSLDGDLLELELTESLLFDHTGDLQQTLADLRKVGVRFSIDDFGTGYSNLGYLNKFEVETLKIDQSFVRKMANSSSDSAIVKAIIQMALSLNIKTVAEGIETIEILGLCKELSCDIGQGYHWSKPIEFDEFVEFVNNYNEN